MPPSTRSRNGSPPAYWATYRTVFVRAVCDSLGNIKQAELLYSFASQAETDSILQLVRSIHLDPATQDGWFLTPRGPEVGQGGDKPFILPFFPPGPASASEVVLDYDKGYARYHTPFLQIGNVDSLTFRSISGPPIPVQSMPVFYQRLHDYLAARYPKYWKMH